MENIIEGLPSNIYYKCMECGGNKFEYMDDWESLSIDEIIKKEKEEKIYLSCIYCNTPVHD